MPKQPPPDDAVHTPAAPEPHSPALPPDVLAAKLDAFRADLTRHLAELVRSLNEELLEQHATLKPLLSVQDVARTLGVSTRTVETLIAQGRLRPLWIKGQRRFHPDAIAAYLRHCEIKPPSSKRRGLPT